MHSFKLIIHTKISIVESQDIADLAPPEQSVTAPGAEDTVLDVRDDDDQDEDDDGVHTDTVREEGHCTEDTQYRVVTKCSQVRYPNFMSVHCCKVR